ncbi:hypothetical protein [Nostoc sp.]
MSTTGYAYAIVPLLIASSASTTVRSIKFNPSTNKIATIHAAAEVVRG